MRLSRPLIAAAGVVLAGVAVAGVGAGATFTTSSASSQTVTAGTLHVSLSAAGGNCTNVDASGCHAITLPAVGPVGSTFESTPTVVTVTNTGNIPAYFNAIQMTTATDGKDASQALLNGLDVCIQSKDPSGAGPWVEARGPLAVADALNPTVVENKVELDPGQSFPYMVNFYAGKDSTNCAYSTHSYSTGPNTSTAWANYIGHAYTAPDSLPQGAQGGVVTPTLTFSFTG